MTEKTFSFVLKNRRSIRKYQNKAISKAVIQQIIEAGRFAPSSHNSQPWRFVVITNRKRIKELSDMIKKFFKKLLVFVPLLSFNKSLKKLGESAKKRIVSDEDVFFYNAPLLILICAEPKGFALVDCTCAAQNMMLMARSLDIGSCWIGFADRAFSSGRLRNKAKVPKGLKVMASLVFGHPVKFTSIVPRKKEADVVEWVK